MRLRVLGLLAPLLCLLVVLASAVVMYGISRDTTQDVQLGRLTSLNRFAQLAAYAESESDLQMLQQEMDTYSGLYDEGLLITVGGTQLTSGGMDSADEAVAELVRNAGLNLDATGIALINPLRTGDALIARPFGNSTQVLGSVAMEVNLQTARAQVLQGWALVVVVAISVCAVLLLLAERLTRWVLGPVHRLDAAVKKLAATRTAAPLTEAGPPELRELSRSFEAMATVMTESLRQQQDLIAETSHQLRNPVAALRLRVDLLKYRLSEQSAAQDVAAVEKELSRVEMLLDGVLRLASAEHRLTEEEAGREISAAGSDRQTVDPVTLLSEELERHSALAQQTGTELRFRAPDDATAPMLVQCHAFELQQVLAEVMENIFKYAPGHPVQIGIHGTGSHVDLVIRDHGPGLDPAELEQATERFWRAESVRQDPGTGLGMAIIDRLIRANGGALLLTSPPEGGLQVTIRLPRAAAEAQTGQTQVVDHG